MAAVASIFAQNLGYFVPLSEWQARLVTAGALLASGILNYVGIRPAALVNNLSSAAKYGGLFALCFLAFTAGNGSTAHFAPAFTGPVSTSVLLTALVAVMFTYDGWADVIRIAGEIENPGRNLPRALLAGTVLIAAIYLTANLAYLYLVPLGEMARSQLIAATAAERIGILGTRGGAVIAALVMISCLGNVAAGATSWPRTQFAIADRGEFFPALARVSPRFQTPSVAIAIFTSVCVVYALSGTFQRLAERFILGLWPFYALEVAAVFLVRRKRPEMPRPYLVWGYPVVPLLFLFASAALILNALWTEPLNTGITFAIVLAGIPAYLLWRAMRARARGLACSG
jgi:amino acid transporter